MYIGDNRLKNANSINGPEGLYTLKKTTEEKDLGVIVSNDHLMKYCRQHIQVTYRQRNVWKKSKQRMAHNWTKRFIARV